MYIYICVCVCVCVCVYVYVCVCVCARAWSDNLAPNFAEYIFAVRILTIGI